MSNTSIVNGFQRMWEHVLYKMAEKADADHTHDASDIVGGTTIIYSETLPENPEPGVIYAVPI